MSILSEVEFFKKNGYVILKNLYSKNDCNSILKHLNLIADENYSQIINMHRSEFLVIQNIKKINRFKFLVEKYNYIKSLEYISKVLLKYLKKKKFVRKIRKLYDNKIIVGLQSQTIFKKPKTSFGKQQYVAHQDNSYAKNKNNLFFTTHLFLEKSNKNNGSLYVYEKSHNLGLLKFNRTKSYGNSKKAGNEIKMSQIQKNYQLKTIIANPGDVLVMHGNLIHGSYINKSKNKSRTTFSLCCIPKGENFIKGRNACREVFRLS